MLGQEFWGDAVQTGWAAGGRRRAGAVVQNLLGGAAMGGGVKMRPGTLAEKV